MKFLTAYHTDVGIKKKTNQDSFLIHQAQTDFGTVLLAVMCDGMGGLAKGEVASATIIRDFSVWFKNTLPKLLLAGFQPEELRRSWEELVATANERIAAYSQNNGVSMGSTCVTFLVIGNTYYIMNIGDSRVYLISDNVYQLTKDQTYVQREVDMGRMTYEQSLVDPQRSVLLQCIGASDVIIPDFFAGSVEENQCYMICCDGFRHVIEPCEFYQYLGPIAARDEQTMLENIKYLTELNKQRMETDNISCLLIRTY